MKIRGTFLKSLLLIMPVIILINCDGTEKPEDKTKAIEVPPSLSENEEVSTGVKIELTEEQSSQLNIKIQKINPNNFTYELTIPGMTFPSPDKFSISSAPISGRITSIKAHEGEYVRKSISGRKNICRKAWLGWPAHY